MFKIDSPSMWSPKITDFLKTVDYENSPWFSSKEVKAFTHVVDDREILAFHASRLTEQEIENIRNFGLEATTGELVTRKLAQARDENSLTEYEYQHLLELAKISLDPDEFRANQICLSIGEFDYFRDKSIL